MLKVTFEIYKGQNPLHILGSGNQVRHYTYGGDIATGMSECIFNPAANNNDFNISNATSTTVLELSKAIWKKIHPDKEFRYVSDDPFEYDVQKRVPDVSKAKRILGFEATTGLDEILDEVIPWVIKMVDSGDI